MIRETAEQSLRQLYQYCRDQKWKGWDPYDGLNSRIFRATPFRFSRVCRLAWIQAFKRMPINLRTPALVPREENPKGLALFARGLTRLRKAGVEWVHANDVSYVYNRLRQLRSPGYDRWCWGYNFDWQGRAFFLKRFAPSAVVTTFAGHAFFDRFERHCNTDAVGIARSACDFILGNLQRPIDTADKVCFSYTPFDQTRIYNVNFLIASLFARAWSTTGDMELAHWSQRTLAYAVSGQTADGSWAYGEDSYQGWVDHFHTCFNLLALDECQRWLHLNAHDKALERGLAFYLDRLFRADGLPRPDTRGDDPIDIHGVALALITLSRFAGRDYRCKERLDKIVEWSIAQMQDHRGFFYYQKRPRGMVRIPYMRWSQAWMFYALSLLVAPEEPS